MRTGRHGRKGAKVWSKSFVSPRGRGVFVTCWGVTMEPSLVQTVSMEHSILQTGSETPIGLPGGC